MNLKLNNVNLVRWLGRWKNWKLTSKRQWWVYSILSKAFDQTLVCYTIKTCLYLANSLVFVFFFRQASWPSSRLCWRVPMIWKINWICLLLNEINTYCDYCELDIPDFLCKGSCCFSSHLELRENEVPRIFCREWAHPWQHGWSLYLSYFPP